MSQAKIVISEIFENVQYQIFNNGGSAQVMNDTPDHRIGTSYSPLDLFPDSPSARVGMQNELNNLLPYTKDDSLYPALIRDAQYSLTGFQANIEKLRLLAVYRPSVFIVRLCFEDNKSVEDVYISEFKDADILGKYYSKLIGKKYLGRISTFYNLDHLKTGYRHLKAKNLNILSSVALNKTLFNGIPDTIKTPFAESHFWSWLLETGYNGKQDSILTLRKYLRSLGFNRGLHFLDGEKQFLRSALHYYYDVNFKYKDHPLKVVK